MFDVSRVQENERGRQARKKKKSQMRVKRYFFINRSTYYRVSANDLHSAKERAPLRFVKLVMIIFGSVTMLGGFNREAMTKKDLMSLALKLPPAK
jgi:hypothetical protein